MPEMSSGLWSETFCHADTGRYRKCLQNKNDRKKLPEIHRMGREIQNMDIFSSVMSFAKNIDL
jgi:hypothetical protein